MRYYRYLVMSEEDLEPSQVRDAILEAWGLPDTADVSVGRLETVETDDRG